MDKKNKIKSFETVGWVHPKETTDAKSVEWLRNLSFDKNLYSDESMKEKKAPACIFVPEKKLMRVMIEQVIECQDKKSDKHELLYKFCDMDPPPPEAIEKAMLFRKKQLAEIIDSVGSQFTDTDE